MIRLTRFLPLLAVLGLLYLAHLGLQRSRVSTPSSASTPRTESHQQAFHPPAAKEKTSLTDHPLRTTNLDLDYPNLKLNQRGHVEYNPSIHSTHPIQLLMERARKQVERLDDRISDTKSLKNSVDDYVNAWRMRPPKGFDKWYEFATKVNSIPLASMFPMAHRPILKFLSIDPKLLRQRVIDSEPKDVFYTLTFVPDGQGDMGTACAPGEDWTSKDWATRGRGRVKIAGPMAWKWRCNNTLHLLLPVLRDFPDEFFKMDPPLKVAFNQDDNARGKVFNEVEKRSETYGRSLKTWPPAQLEAAERSMQHTTGWHWTCSPDSPLKQACLSRVLNDDIDDGSSIAGKKSFVADFYMSADVCYNPEMRQQNSMAINDERLANVPMDPYISVARSLHNSDIAGAPLDNVFVDVDLVPWKDKTNEKVFWRGSPTGLTHQKGNGWRRSQRHRLNFFANNQSDALATVLIERGNQVRLEQFPIKKLNQQWFDIGLSGGPSQCNQEDGSCEELRKSVPWKEVVRGAGSLANKYVVDVDGNAWSSRFRRLLNSNHVVLKSTAYPEWFNDILVPWYHYVPIRHDYEDVYDIMAYFQGAPDKSTNGHDELAEQIAMNGVNFVKTHWRVADMQSFMFLLLIEYWRLMSDDRQATSFK